MAENYVLQSLTAQFQASFRYWTSGNKAEVDFLLQHGNHIYPVEVKADQNITGKSLIQYEDVYKRQELKNMYPDTDLGSLDNKWNIQEAGSYRITIDQLKETISIVKQ